MARFVLLLCLASILVACSGRAEPPPLEAPVSDCSVTLDPGANVLSAALKAAADGAVVCLKPGTYEGFANFTRSVTVKALGEGVVLDAGGESPVINVGEERISVTLVGLTLRNGFNASGGALLLEARSQIAFRNCRFEGNQAGQYGGGAIHAQRGKVVLEGCTFEGNAGALGAAMLADGVSFWEISGSTARNNRGESAVLAIRDGARVEMAGTDLTGNAVAGAAVVVDGTTTRGPEVSIAGCSLGEPGVDVQSKLANVAVAP